ncbi:hypothetical protein CEXT_285441 [Caerostris extrusa]|uniref:Uncharacterized protein n=1 Tax=Caerostris extrusa TaxID=172846 RepID=A0AAV4QUQ1_CAEEX|nr:hypothetical protein CEXT_285441 [Caerostris extrusa]
MGGRYIGRSSNVVYSSRRRGISARPTYEKIGAKAVFGFSQTNDVNSLMMFGVNEPVESARVQPMTVCSVVDKPELGWCPSLTSEEDQYHIVRVYWLCDSSETVPGRGCLCASESFNCGSPDLWCVQEYK